MRTVRRRCSTEESLSNSRNAGVEPTVIEYLKTPPDRGTLESLIQRTDIRPRDLLRQKGTPYEELGLGADHWTDAQLIDQMLAHPILINRPSWSRLGAQSCVDRRRWSSRARGSGEPTYIELALPVFLHPNRAALARLRCGMDTRVRAKSTPLGYRLGKSSYN